MSNAVTAATASKNIAALLDTGVLRVNDVAFTFLPQTANRLVLGFLTNDDKGAWLRDVCADAGLSLVLVQGPNAESFALRDVVTHLKAMANNTLCKDAKSVSLCGDGAAGLVAMAHAAIFPAPFVVAFNPVPIMETYPAKTLIKAARNCRAATVFFDPFHDPHRSLRAAFASDTVQWLKSFALLDNTLNRLWRMKHLPTFLPSALLGELDGGVFYKQIRNRKNFRFYRTGMEAALGKRGKTTMQKRFRALFRKHLETSDPNLQFEQLKTAAAQGRPANADAWVVAGQSNGAETMQDWPSLPGNVWMLENTNGTMRYLSDRWHGLTIGYEERAGVTLAQTSALAIGMVNFGQGAQVERPQTRLFPWHVVGPDLNGQIPLVAPLSEATLLSEQKYQSHTELATVIGFGHPAPGLTAREATRGAPAYDAIITSIQSSAEVLGRWDKRLFVDRVRLALLSGAPRTSQSDATLHLATVASQLSEDIVHGTGQAVAPAFVVVQSAGSRIDGASAVILAEGRFDLDNPALKAIVSSPAYPWALMDGTPATQSAAGALLLDELSMRAVAARQAGKPWFCPYMRLATCRGRKITVEFSTMNGLVLEDGPHGFHILSNASETDIATVEVTSASEVTLTLANDPPDAEMQLAYAWGHRTDTSSAHHTANHGSLRDQWETQSIGLPDQTLRRFALAGCVKVQR